MSILKLTCKQSQSQKNRNTNEAMLMYRYSHQSKTTYFYTKKNIDRLYFDNKNNCIKKSYPGHNKFNMVLSKERQKIEDIINSAIAEDINPTTDYVKTKYHGGVEDRKKSTSKTFWEFVDLYMDEGKIKLNSNTLRSYNNIFNNLRSYEAFHRIILNWDSINLEFYYKFLDFYTNYKKLGNNGFGKIIKVLKSILNSATDRGYNSNLAYKKKEFKALREDVNNVYLDEDELKTIANLKLNCAKLVRARDLFIIACYTGLRFSDLSKLTAENIHCNLIKTRTIKTGVEVVLPLLQEVKNVLDKYNGNPPKSFCNQKMNEYLKIIAKEAKLNGIETKNHTSGNKVIRKSFEKWELISTHTARRSFATNMYKRGVNPLAIMQLTGHSTEKSFMTYIKISKEENALRILEQFKISA